MIPASTYTYLYTPFSEDHEINQYCGLGIGWAKVSGLDTYLGADDDDWEWIVVSFDVAWLACQWSGLSLLWLSPRTLMLSAITIWTLAAGCECFSPDFATACALRAVSGSAQGCLTGVIPFYISLFYRENDLPVRLGLYMSGSILATPLAGWLSMLVLKIVDDVGLSDITRWRYLFFVEMLISGLVTAWMWRRLPASPDHAGCSIKYDECASLERNSQSYPRRETKPTYTRRREAQAALSRPIPYFLLSIFCLNSMTFMPMTVFLRIGGTTMYSYMPVYLPATVFSMGYSPNVSQSLYAPPYILAVAAMMVTVRFWTGRTLGQLAWLVLPSAIAFNCLAVLKDGPTSTWVRYLCLVPIAMSYFNTLLIVFTTATSGTKFERLFCLSLIQGVGQWVPTFGMRLYPPESYPFYRTGMLIAGIAELSIGGLAIAFVYWSSRCRQDYIAIINTDDGHDLPVRAESTG
jgi:hypothetical protein